MRPSVDGSAMPGMKLMRRARRAHARIYHARRSANSPCDRAFGAVSKIILGFPGGCARLRKSLAPVAQLDRASDFEGEESPVSPSLAQSTTGDATVDDAKLAEATAPLPFAATFAEGPYEGSTTPRASDAGPKVTPRSWLAVLADLGPGLVKAAVELPAGAVDALISIGGDR
jgi:hypothetical protein